MNSTHARLSGINAWFIIEILSFYGYILAASLYVVTRSCRSSWGCKRKESYQVEDPLYKHDFVSYYKRELDWAAFVQILV